MHMHGPNPKPPSRRRRTNKPASYGAAEPVTAPAAAFPSARTLGIDAPVHKLVKSMWAALQTSCESRFFSTADWERARFELWHCNQLLTSQAAPIRLMSAAVQNGLSALLISPARKRRVGIELKPVDVDPDEVAAVSIIDGYRDD